jgi:hypothetical protein
MMSETAKKDTGNTKANSEEVVIGVVVIVGFWGFVAVVILRELLMNYYVEALTVATILFLIGSISMMEKPIAKAAASVLTNIKEQNWALTVYCYLNSFFLGLYIVSQVQNVSFTAKLIEILNFFDLDYVAAKLSVFVAWYDGLPAGLIHVVIIMAFLYDAIQMTRKETPKTPYSFASQIGFTMLLLAFSYTNLILPLCVTAGVVFAIGIASKQVLLRADKKGIQALSWLSYIKEFSCNFAINVIATPLVGIAHFGILLLKERTFEPPSA